MSRVTRVTDVTGNEVTELLAQPERTIKPRNREYIRRPVIAIRGDTTLDENGEVGTVADLIESLPKREPTLFACVGAADFVSHLNGVFLLRTPASWQWRIGSYEREICRPTDGVKVASRVSVIIHYFGWKNGNYHKIIDPISMYGRRLDEICPGENEPIIRLLQWATQLRDFCHDQGLEVRPTIGSIAAQFLTDKRFYSKPRRKVPAKTNESVREHLPGNYYVLNVHPRPDHEYTAHYLDQHRAHHYHARTLILPDSDHLYAYGRFLDLGSPVFKKAPEDFYGLYCLDLIYEGGVGRTRAFRWNGISGDLLGTNDELDTRKFLVKQFVYSNELPHLLDMGYRVSGVRAAWGSRHKDTGLGKYSCFAEEQLDKYDDAQWLKPLLLATYGILATRPKHAESVFRLAKTGEQVMVRTGARQLNGKHTKGSRKLEPRIANVLHRGMIEAATRSESVGLAQYLNQQGHQILSIYADAVMVAVDDGKPLPPIPEPWRLKETLNHLQFINQQAFISGEMTKLPGVSRELREYSQAGYRHAPRRVHYEAVTGRPIISDKRI